MSEALQLSNNGQPGPTAQYTMTKSNVDKIQTLVSKFETINDDTKAKRENLRQEVDQGIRKAEERLNQYQLAERAQFGAIKDQFQLAQDALQKGRAARDILDEKKSREINVVEAALVTSLNIERQHRKDMQDALNKLIADRTLQIQQQLKEEGEHLIQQCAEARKEVQTKVQDLKEQMAQTKQNANEEFDRIARHLDEEISKIKAQIGAEKSERNAVTDQCYNMLTDLAHRLQEKIKEEKEEREQCEEALLRLLEETIEKCDTEGNTVPANPAK